MEIDAILGDITKFEGDAIVSAANERMLGGGGVDGAIHRAAGPQLLTECEKVPEVRLGVRCPTGEARITAGGNLKARWVVHTVGPVYRDGRHGEPEKLANCYRNSLQLAVDNGIKSIAFPSISTGVYGYPVEEAAAIAVREVRAFLATHPEMSVTFVCFNGPRDKVDVKAVYDKLIGTVIQAPSDGIATPRRELTDDECAYLEAVSLRLAKTIRRINKFIDEGKTSRTASSGVIAKFKSEIDLARLEELAEWDGTGKGKRMLAVYHQIEDSEASGWTSRVLPECWQPNTPSQLHDPSRGKMGNVDMKGFGFKTADYKSKLREGVSHV